MISPLRGIRLVALDLDGTLLPASKVLTGRAIGVLRDVRAAGIEVTLATGKAWSLTRRYAEELGLTAPCVALDGSFVSTAGDRAIHRRTLAPDDVLAIHEAVLGIDVGWFYCHDRLGIRAHRRVERWMRHMRVCDVEIDVTDGAPHAADAPPHEAFGFTLIGQPDAVAAAHESVAALGISGVDLLPLEFWEGHRQLHVRPAGADKRHGLGFVLRDLGLAPSQMLAAGDWWNDVTMLEMAGVAVAPANAEQAVRDLADHVLPGTCEEDAVVAFLEEALRGV